MYSHLKSLWVSLFVCECVFLSQYKVSLNLTIFNEQLLVRLLCILFKLQHFVWLCLFAQLAHWCFLIKEIVSQVAQNCLNANNQLLQIAKCFGFMSKSSIEYMYMYLYSHSVAFTRCHCKHCNTPELIKCANLYKNLLELYAREMPKITLSKAIICIHCALYILYVWVIYNMMWAFVTSFVSTVNHLQKSVLSYEPFYSQMFRGNLVLTSA